MPDRRFIHARADVSLALTCALEAGLKILDEDAHEGPAPLFHDASTLAALKDGAFLGFRDDWVYGEITTIRISGGIDAGKYANKTMNSAAIQFAFLGERTDHGRRRLGGGEIGFRRHWLQEAEPIRRKVYGEVEEVYKALCKRIWSGIIAKGGIHRYYVCVKAAELIPNKSVLPPYDYIEWPPPAPPRARARKPG